MNDSGTTASLRPSALDQLARHIRGPVHRLTARDRETLRRLAGVWNTPDGEAIAQAIEESKGSPHGLA